MRTLGGRHRSWTGRGLRLVLALLSYAEIRTLTLIFPWQDILYYHEPHDPLLPVPCLEPVKEILVEMAQWCHLRETGLFHSLGETVGQMHSSPGHHGMTEEGAGPVEPGVRCAGRG